MLAMPNRISLIHNLLMKTDNLKMPAIEDSLLEAFYMVSGFDPKILGLNFEHILNTVCKD